MKIIYKIFLGFLLITLSILAIIYLFIFPFMMEQLEDSVDKKMMVNKKFVEEYLAGIMNSRTLESQMIATEPELVELFNKKSKGEKVSKINFLTTANRKKTEYYGNNSGEGVNRDVYFLFFDKDGKQIGKSSNTILKDKKRAENSIKELELIPKNRGDDFQISEAFLSSSKNYIEIRTITSIDYNQPRVTKFIGTMMVVTPLYKEFVDRLKKLLNVDVIIETEGGKLTSTLFKEKRVETDITFDPNSKIFFYNGLKYYVNTIELKNVFQKKIGQLHLLSGADEIIEAQSLLKERLIFIFVIGIVLSLIIATTLSLSIAKPINVFKSYIEAMANQDFEIKVDSSLVNRQDEIGYFAKSFENLKESFLINQQQLNYYNKELESSYKEMKNYLYIFEVKNKELLDRIKEQEIIKDILNKGIREINEINVFFKFLLKSLSKYKNYKRAEFIYKSSIDGTYERIVYIPATDKYVENFYNESLKYLVNERSIVKSNYIELPIKFRNDIGGSIKIEGIELNENVERTITTIISEVEIILDNVELYYSMDKKIIELSFLNNVSVALSSTKEIIEINNMIGDAIAVLFSVNDYNLYIYSDGYFWEYNNLDGETVKVKKKRVENPETYINSRNETIRVKDDYFIPLVAKKKLIGAIRVDGKMNFKIIDKNIIKIFVTQVAIILQNHMIQSENRKMSFNIIKSLSEAIEEKDIYTRGHSERVMEYGILIAEKMGLAAEEVEKIKYAGILHDVGKIGIPESILLKSSKLTDEEYAIIKEHPAKGAKILAHIESLAEVVEIVKYHHERPDGRGYPEGLMGEEIPLGARILSVADTIDAMTSNRPYRKGLILENVKSELDKYKGVQFDSKVTEVVLKLISDGEFSLLTNSDEEELG